MKIRTITCHDVCNYGASLQALALQIYLESLGHDVKIIDYLPEYSKAYNIWKVSPASHLYKLSKYIFFVRLFWAIRTFFHILPTLKRKKAFKAFNKKYYRLTKHYNTYYEIAMNPPEADVYIAGSDQIWRTTLNNGKDPAFYLQFGNDYTKRLSYAASFGCKNLTDGMDFLIRTYLSKLDAISVRESSGVNIIEALGLSAQLVLDPIFLLSKIEWMNLLEIKEKLISVPYILVYDLNRYHLCMKKFAIAYAKERNLKIVAVNDTRVTKYANININNAGPSEFVNLIANAQFVLSDSFHATAMSTIMHTPFRVYFDKPAATRISNFLDILHLSHCMNCPIDSSYKIDWKAVQVILDNKINMSKLFLRNNLK